MNIHLHLKATRTLILYRSRYIFSYAQTSKPDINPKISEKDQAGRGGKAAIFNPPTGVLSKAYDGFIHPIVNDNKNGFDVHIYFYQVREDEVS